MFKRIQGKTKFMYYPMTTSTEVDEGDLMALNVGSNLLIEATNTTAGNIMVGVITHTIATTDSDYATAREVEVEVPVEKNVIWSCDTAGTGTPAAADVGTYADIDGGGEVDVDNSSYDIFFITRIAVSSTTAGAADIRGILNIGPESLGVAGD